MTTDNIIEKIADCLGNEFQTIWIVDIKTGEMDLFMEDKEKAAEHCVMNAIAMNNYDDIREWYILNCIANSDHKRVAAQSKLDYVVSRIEDGIPYYVEYSRIIGGIINYNQIMYARLDSLKDELTHILLGFRNIDVRKKAERDDLTGVYTRQVFFQKAEQLLKDNPEVQYDLMISDIVDFKDINESYGPATGDAILRNAGEFLAPKITDDVLVGRYGGDQFVIMASHDYMETVNALPGREEYSASERGNSLPKIVTKFGIYQGVKHNKTIISTCDKAHCALNSIKHQYGKTVAIYDDKIRKELDTNRKIESSMHQALAEEQFKVYYQPKHDAATGKLVGAEALIRWVHPEYGFMSPGDFIPLFERNGFIVETDAYVWRRTSHNLKLWTDMGIKTVPISVNASKLTFAQDDLLWRMHKSVSEDGVDPAMLHLEITETMMTDDVDSLIRKLTAIREAGHQVELDDFGAGYSSINILSTLPLDVIKLDMSFMKQFGDEKRAKVLAACIKLAKELGYKTVSEGVELKEQCEVLCVLGVDAIQGYFYSKPLSEEDFEEYLKAHA